jgi:hypothetical protein
MDDATYEGSRMESSKPAENAHLPRDSMVTVRLSEPPSLTVVTQSLVMDEVQQNSSAEDTLLDTPDLKVDCKEDLKPTLSSRYSMSIAAGDENMDTMRDESDEQLPIDAGERRGSDSTEDSSDEDVNWAELEKTEEQEPRDQDSEDVSGEILGFGALLIFIVDCFTACQIGTGEQSSGYGPKIRPSIKGTIESKRQPIPTSFHATIKENG